MSEAWHINLPSSPKLLLMALADIANDVGVCWPSVRHLATKCSLSERAVRTYLADLERSGCLKIERRFREDGSQASNRYVVFPNDHRPGEHADPLQESATPPARPPSAPIAGLCEGPADLAAPSQARPNAHGADDSPATSIGPAGVASGGCAGPHPGGVPSHSPLNHQTTPSRLPQPQQKKVGSPSLAFPSGISESDKAHAETILQAFDLDTGQQILDELAGRARQQPIRNWRGYLRELVARAVDGRFAPELAPEERASRDIRAKNLAMLAQHDQSLREWPRKVNLDALPPRMRAIFAKRIFGIEITPPESTRDDKGKDAGIDERPIHRSDS